MVPYNFLGPTCERRIRNTPFKPLQECVIKLRPSQKGTFIMRSDVGLKGMFLMRRSHVGPEMEISKVFKMVV